MAASPQRIHITRGRVRDYVEAEELRRQTGMPPERFALVALKELLDNFLGATEKVCMTPPPGAAWAPCGGGRDRRNRSKRSAINERTRGMMMREVKRNTNGTFANGTAPGPGRPAGWARAFRRAVTEEDIEEIVRALVSSAKEGDKGAATLLLRLCVPVIRETHAEFLEELGKA